MNWRNKHMPTPHKGKGPSSWPRIRSFYLRSEKFKGLKPQYWRKFNLV